MSTNFNKSTYKLFIKINKACEKFPQNTEAENIKLSQTILDSVVSYLKQLSQPNATKQTLNNAQNGLNNLGDNSFNNTSTHLSQSDIDFIDYCLHKAQIDFGDCAGGTLLYNYRPRTIEDAKLLLKLPKISGLIKQNMLHSLVAKPKNYNDLCLPSDIFPINFYFDGYTKALLKAHPEMAQFASTFKPLEQNIDTKLLNHKSTDQTQSPLV